MFKTVLQFSFCTLRFAFVSLADSRACRGVVPICLELRVEAGLLSTSTPLLSFPDGDITALPSGGPVGERRCSAARNGGLPRRP